MQALRSIAVLIIAYYAIGTVVGVVDAGLHIVFPHSLPDEVSGQLPDAGWLVWHIVVVGLVTVASSYLAALTVGRAEFLHISILGVWMLLVGLATWAQFADRWPTWFAVSNLLVPIPAILLGWHIRIRQKRAQTQKVQQDKARHMLLRAILWGTGLGLLLAAHDYQNDPIYRRHFSIRSAFWTVELPLLMGVGAFIGYAVGEWRRSRLKQLPEGASP